MKPKVLVIRTAGTNCDKETEFAFSSAGANTTLRHINYIKQKDELSDYQIICIPGGFSYGDDLGAGKILALEFICWFKNSLKKFVAQGGLILGICNGFQVLVKTGILPDLDFKQKVTLTNNDSGRFEDRWVYLKIRNQKSEIRNQKREIESVWLEGLPEVFNLPVAHGEGKFYAERSILDKIEVSGQVALRYVDQNSQPKGYPFNPNGSLNNIAGITDASGRILGLMPHPERCIFRHHSPFWKEREVYPWGLKFFANAISYFK
ncbi:MAG: phosphoribosylformylglycinamidine synthase I [Omnitrophica bacterium]|nr:phosphoribosylformylglycinamidine synthase I [Candidatus Omnitrophota bacterium]